MTGPDLFDISQAFTQLLIDSCTEFGDSGVKGGDPFCDPSQDSSAHICISCVSSMKLCVFETPAMRFTISMNDASLKRLPLSITITV